MEIVDREREAIKRYVGIGYKFINNMLEADISVEGDMLHNIYATPDAFDTVSVEQMMEDVKNIYSAMIKYSYDARKLDRIYRGTTNTEMQRLGNTGIVNKFLSTTYDKNAAMGNFGRGAFVNIDVEPNTPYLYVDDIIDRENNEREYIISPFLQIKMLKHVYDRADKDGSIQSNYHMEVKRQELRELPEEEISVLREQVLVKAKEISGKQKEYFRVAEAINFKNEMIEKYQQSDPERKAELETEKTVLIAQRDALRKEVESWKKDVAAICMSECRSVEKNLTHQLEEEKIIVEKRAEEERIEAKRGIIKSIDDSKDMVCNNIKRTANVMDKDYQSLANFKQQIVANARVLKVQYRSYIEMIKDLPQYTRELEGQITSFSAAKDNLEFDSESELDSAITERQEVKQTVAKLNQVSNFIGRLPVNELIALEENSFKQGIVNKLQNIRLDISARELQQELAELDNVSGVKKLAFKITGREGKNNERKLEIDKAIKQINRKKLEMIQYPGEPNIKYSVHEIVAEIVKLKNFCPNDPVFSEQLMALNELESGLGTIYRINPEQVNQYLNGNVTRGQRFSLNRDSVMARVNDIKAGLQHMSRTIRDSLGNRERNKNREFEVNR